MTKLTYSEISNFAFAQAMQKISNTPTHGQTASQIHKVTKELDRIRKQISKEYQEKIATVYGKKNESGELVRPDGEPNGFEPDETKVVEFEKAQEAFGKTEVEIKAPPFTIQVIGDIKVSAKDLEALAGLYAGNIE